MEGGEVLADNITKGVWRNLLPVGFVETVKVDSLVVAGLRYEEKPVGFFYADCAVSGRRGDEGDRRNLMQFATQARLALRLCTYSRRFNPRVLLSSA